MYRILFIRTFWLQPYFTGRAFWDLTIAAARCIATFVKSFRYLCLTIKSLTLCKLRRGPALNVTVSVDFPGLYALPFLMVTVNPLLSEAGATAMAFLFTTPL